MSDPFDLVCERVPKLRTHGPDRARGCCPAHDGGNPSALSIGRGENGSVLLKCWQGCDVDQIVAALGLELTDLFPQRESHGRSLQRRRLISAAQALDLIHDEAQLIALCAANIAHGVQLTDDDRTRCLTAAGRIAYLRNEVRS